MSIHNAYSKYKSTFQSPHILKLDKTGPCSTIDKIAIIVPFRDNKYQNRKTQLAKFLPYYKKHLPEATIFVIEQTKDGQKFNRGKLLNIGFDLAKTSHNIFIFHDVDLLADQQALTYYKYSCPNSAVHIGHLWREKYTFDKFLGGVVSINKQSFEKINGFPNNFWGWGGEDDAFRNRLILNNMVIFRPQNGTIKEMTHKRTSDFAELTLEPIEKKRLILDDLTNWTSNGLSNLKYKVIKKTNTHYLVDIYLRKI